MFEKITEDDTGYNIVNELCLIVASDEALDLALRNKRGIKKKQKAITKYIIFILYSQRLRVIELLKDIPFHYQLNF